MKRISVKTLVVACLVLFVASALAVSAASSWNHTITGIVSSNGLGFGVYKDSACVTLWDGSVSTVVTDLSKPFTETYYIKNLSNGPLTVTGAVVAGATSYAWADGKNSLALAAGEVGVLSLTVSNFNGGVAGSFSVAVTFSST